MSDLYVKLRRPDDFSLDYAGSSGQKFTLKDPGCGADGPIMILTIEQYNNLNSEGIVECVLSEDEYNDMVSRVRRVGKS